MFKIGQQIKLNAGERKYADWLGKARTAENRRDNVPNERVGGNSDSSAIDREGVAGEFAFCKLAGIYPPTYYKNDEVLPWDCIVGGLMIDIKTTSHVENPLLIIKRTKKVGDVDGYVLMLENKAKDIFIYCGFITSYDALQRENLRDIGHGLSYVINPNQLKNWL